MKDALYFWRENKEMKKQLRPTKGGRKYHVITDETGSVRKIYKDGEEEWSGTYSPYGKLSSYEGSFEFSGMYAGKEIDTETGLTYHWNRWRNEEGDAFISEDPIRDGYNWYGYALGNPFKYADGTGLATYVCRDGTFCNEGDISNPSYRADCYHYNGYNAGTIASMSGPAYNLANNGGQATLSLAGTRADPGRNKSSPSAAEEIKNCGNVDIEKITLGKISDTVELLEVKAEVDERITELVVDVILNKIEDYAVLKMGGYKLNSSEVFDLLIDTVIASNLMGKKYSTDQKKPYVCTTFVSEVLTIISKVTKDFLPGGQKVVDSISKLSDLIEASGKNPAEGAYVFYYDYGDGTGHTGFIRFSKEGNAEILHNGRDVNGNNCVNLRTRDNRDFATWFGDNENGKLYYKELEMEIWME